MESDGQSNELSSQLDGLSRAARRRTLRRIVGGVVGCASLLFVTGLVMKAVRADAAEPPAGAVMQRSEPAKAAPNAATPAAPAVASPPDVAPHAAAATAAPKAARPAPGKTMATMKRGSALR